MNRNAIRPLGYIGLVGMILTGVTIVTGHAGFDIILKTFGLFVLFGIPALWFGVFTEIGKHWSVMRLLASRSLFVKPLMRQHHRRPDKNVVMGNSHKLSRKMILAVLISISPMIAFAGNTQELVAGPNRVFIDSPADALVVSHGNESAMNMSSLPIGLSEILEEEIGEHFTVDPYIIWLQASKAPRTSSIFGRSDDFIVGVTSNSVFNPVVLPGALCELNKLGSCINLAFSENDAMGKIILDKGKGYDVGDVIIYNNLPFKVVGLVEGISSLGNLVGFVDLVTLSEQILFTNNVTGFALTLHDENASLDDELSYYERAIVDSGWIPSGGATMSLDELLTSTVSDPTAPWWVLTAEQYMWGNLNFWVRSALGLMLLITLLLGISVIRDIKKSVEHDLQMSQRMNGLLRVIGTTDEQIMAQNLIKVYVQIGLGLVFSLSAAEFVVLLIKRVAPGIDPRISWLHFFGPTLIVIGLTYLIVQRAVRRGTAGSAMEAFKASQQ